jgi:hypothetical protein
MAGGSIGGGAGEGGASGGGGQAGSGAGGCLQDSDCTAAPENGCHAYHCQSGACVQSALPDGTPASDSVVGDCTATSCVGGVPQKAPDDNDPEDDGDPCTLDKCQPDGITKHLTTAGATCGQGKKCSTTGMCRPLLQTGCADGTREGFRELDAFPEIAACNGAWSVPGLLDTTAPTCARDAGNDGGHPGGSSCSAADVCAEGWHVCQNSGDVAKHLPVGKTCSDGALSDASFYATAQPGAGDPGYCTATPADMNDVLGCGNPFAQGSTFGLICSPLNAFIGNGCSSLNAEAKQPIPNWKCGAGDNGDAYLERALITKDKSPNGGVMCCKG